MDLPLEPSILQEELATMETINSLPEEFSDFLVTLEAAGHKAIDERHEHDFEDAAHVQFYSYPDQVTDLLDIYRARVESVHVVSTPPFFEVTIKSTAAGTFTIHQDEDRFWIDNDTWPISDSAQTIEASAVAKLFETMMFKPDVLVDINEARQESDQATEINLRNKTTALLVNQVLETAASNSTTIKRYQFSYPAGNGNPAIAMTFSANVTTNGSTAYDIVAHLDDPNGGHCLLKTHYDSHENKAVNFFTDGKLWLGNDFDEPESIEDISIALYIEEIIRRIGEEFKSGEKTLGPV